MTVFPCFNCDAEVPARSLFCSELCRQTAKVVRYGRAVHADGRIKRADVEEALKIKVASVLGGGYPADERRLSAEQRQAVFDRDEGKCQVCGGPATEIDHIDPMVGGDMNRPGNLQALCNECHRRKTIAGHHPIETEDEFLRATELLSRIRSPEPLRDCDDPDWSSRWRALRKERLKAV
jgi:5-methylcytosine-specific restriction endonuclease McrA